MIPRTAGSSEPYGEGGIRLIRERLSRSLGAQLFVGVLVSLLLAILVYGICFAQDGRVLLRIEIGKYKLTGGKPESSDAGRAETLKREFLEEANTLIKAPVMVGYQLINEESCSI